MKKIKVFMSTASTYAEREILKKFAQGIKASEGLEQDVNYTTSLNTPSNTSVAVEYTFSEVYTPCDLAIMFGSWKADRKGHHLVRLSVAKNAEAFLVIETPLLNRLTDSLNTEWRVGYNGFLSGEAGFPQLGETEAKQRMLEKEVTVPDWNYNEKGHIVLALQLPGDASLHGDDIMDWAYNTMMSIREYSDRKIILRTHPLMSDRGYQAHLFHLLGRLTFSKFKNYTLSLGNERSWSKDLENAYCTVTYSSGLAIDSIMNGVPTIACDSANFAYKISSQLIEEIENLKIAPELTKQKWLQNLVALQYSEDEMVSGLAWEYIRQMLKVQQVL